jgi:hypothetical protein
LFSGKAAYLELTIKLWFENLTPVRIVQGFEVTTPMDARPSNHDLRIDVMVNGRYYPSVQIRHMSESIHDFDVLIDDSQVGTMALTEDMNLQLRSSTGWCLITLTTLKSTLAHNSSFPRPLDIPSSSEMAELKLFATVDGYKQAPGLRSGRAEGFLAYDWCVRRVRAVLGEAAIACTPCGGVFVVPDRERARTVLLRAGFLVSPISPGALVETFSGSTVYLLERR